MTRKLRTTAVSLVAALSVAAVGLATSVPSADAMPPRGECHKIQADYSYYLYEYRRAFIAAGGSSEQTRNYAALAYAARAYGQERGCRIR